MKFKTIIAGLILSISNLSNAQINLEKSYTSKHYIYSLAYDKSTFFSNGINYYTYDIQTQKLTIYDVNHVQKKQFSLPMGANEVLLDFELITDKLFNIDDKIEFLYSVENTSTHAYSLILANEDGVQLNTFNKSRANLVKNSVNSFKLVLSKSYSSSTDPMDPNRHLIQEFDVYSLPGTLALEQENQYHNNITRAYPNPSDSFITFDNKSNNNQKTLLEIFNLEGKKILEKSVINNNEPITIDVNPLSKGIYIYKLNGESNKFIKD